MSVTIAGIVGYVGLQILIGAWVSRRIATETDYVLAGRSFGVGLAAVSIFATWFGAEVVIGAASRVYTSGLSGAQAEPFAYAAGILVMGLVFAARLWRRGIQTLADFFRFRFSERIERLAAVLLIPGSVLWAAAQIRGFGQIVGSAAGIELETALTLAVIAVVVYTVLGGLLADAYNDAIQSAVIVAGLFGLCWIAVSEAGGIAAGLARIEPARWLVFPADQSLLALIEKWAIPICGSVVAVELISRVLACRSPEVARAGATLGGVCYLLIALIPVTLGLIGPFLVPDIADSEQIVPEIAQRHLPPVLYVLFVGALISAILTTVDSALLAAGTLLSHNLLLRLRPTASERIKVAVARASVATLGIIAYLLSLRATHISDLVELASAFASAGIFVTLVFGLLTRMGGEFSAFAAMASGALVWLAGAHLFEIQAPYVAGLAAAAIAYIAVAQFEPRSPAPA
ncbi:MAG: sodium:solute symporter family protein [Hyphomicrobiaceae bacterium]